MNRLRNMILYRSICFSIILSSALMSNLVNGKEVVYDLTIGYFLASPDGHATNVLGINRQLPSPTITVTEGDTLIVNVFNEDPVHSHSIHWHGLSQKGSWEMDGVVGVTQCGIPPFHNMTYRFIIRDHPGTYWYHGHSGLNKVAARGMAGMLIVQAREGKDVHANLYSDEKELVIQDWFRSSPFENYLKSMGGLHSSVTQSSNSHNVGIHPWISGLINGVGGGDENSGEHNVIKLKDNLDETVRSGDLSQGVRLRIVNAGEVFALKVSVDRHRLLIISTDGTDTEPFLVDSVILHTGERYDAVLLPRHESLEDEIQNENGNFWIRAETLEGDKDAQVFKQNRILGILRYPGASDELPVTKRYSPEKEVILNCFDSLSVITDATGNTIKTNLNNNCLPVTALRTHSSLLHQYDILTADQPDETHEVAFEHSRSSKYFGHYTRVRKNVYDAKRPSRKSHREGAYTQFVFPSRPQVWQRGENATNDNSSEIENRNEHYHEHTVALDLKHGNNIQLIWNHRAPTAHPIHIHGYKFIVAATHEADISRCNVVACPDEEDWFTWPLDKSIIDNTIEGGYVVKDTAVLPAGGYLVTRFAADNPGTWLAHCHIDYHLKDGMGLILEEHGELENSAPAREDSYSISGFPQCFGETYDAFDFGAQSSRQPACECLPDPETTLQAAPEKGWKCSKEHLCRHQPIVDQNLEITASYVASHQEGGDRVRGVPRGRNWLKIGVSTSFNIIVYLILFFGIWYWRSAAKKDKEDIDDSERSTTSRSMRSLRDLRENIIESSCKIKILCLLIFEDEWKFRMTHTMLFQTVGLALVGGLIYFDAGFDSSERMFREKIAFNFWMCAFWSVSTIYTSIVTYYSPDWITSDGRLMVYQNSSCTKDDMSEKSRHGANRVIGRPQLSRGQSIPSLFRSSITEHAVIVDERRRPSYVDDDEPFEVSIFVYHCMRWLIGFCLASPFPILFAFITDALTQMAPSISAIFAIGFFLLLTQQSFDALGRLMAEIAGRKSVSRAICLGTIVSQMLVIAGGFYRTVHPIISSLCPIRYSFSGISKLLFKASDSFWCTPERAHAWRGHTWCPLEESGAVSDLKIRGISIVDSYRKPVAYDAGCLIAMIFVLRIACCGIAYLKACKQKHIDDEELSDLTAAEEKEKEIQRYSDKFRESKYAKFYSSLFHEQQRKPPATVSTELDNDEEKRNNPTKTVIDNDAEESNGFITLHFQNSEEESIHSSEYSYVDNEVVETTQPLESSVPR